MGGVVYGLIVICLLCVYCVGGWLICCVNVMLKVFVEW